MLRRKSRETGSASDGASASSAVAHGSADVKGRPTPKRRDAERRNRTTVTAGAVRGGTNARGNRMTARERRAAMARGDESALLPRDRGPVRRFARDYVDSRRHIGEYFMPAALAIVLLQFVHNPTVVSIALLLMLALFVALVASALRLRRNLNAELIRRFPNQSTRGVPLYAIMRSTQFRRLRMPAPQVSRGAQI